MNVYKISIKQYPHLNHLYFGKKKQLKKQIEIWETNKIEDLISETSDIEYAVKKNPNISVKVLTNFILDRISS